MNKTTISFLLLFIFSLAVCVWGISTINVKPIEPLKKMTSCSCVSECLQDYEEFGTFNFFTMKAHRSFNFESKKCESVNATVKAMCCYED